jgi:phosphoesterase RecJ-like protein
MLFDLRIVNEIKNKIENAEKILVISHRRPDADTIGANLSMRQALLNMGKNVTSACHDDIGEENYFLPGVYSFVKEIGQLEDYDLIISVDCGDRKITDYHYDYPELFSGKYQVINIDHHISNDNFGTVNLVRSDFASTTQILYFLYKALNIKINSEMATLLLAGLYFDTGSFRHDNTSVQVLEVAAKLTALGARASYIAKNLFGIISVPTLKIWGKAFDRVKINSKGIASSMVTIDEIIDLGGNPDDIKGADLITYINSIPESKFAMLLTEKKGLVKGSFRTADDNIDVAAIAKKYFQGGGHKKAAGFAVPGKLYLNEERRKILKD